jgi:hypothetical protein
VAGGIKIEWFPFPSAIYPYTVSQPSSFRHIVLQDLASHNVDFFFPSLGSYTTNVNIYAVPGTKAGNEKDYLQSIGGHNIRRSTWLNIAGKKVPLMCGNFKGLVARYTLEQSTFAADGLVWHLTMSYDMKYRKLMRPTLLKIIKSFHLRT